MDPCRGRAAVRDTVRAGVSQTTGDRLLPGRGRGPGVRGEVFDELDFRVLREVWVGSGLFFRSDRVSLEQVARALGVHRSTVAARLAKWERNGALLGWSIELEPGAVGLVAAHVQFHARAADLRRAVEVAVLVEGVRSVATMDSDWVGVLLFADDAASLERTLDLLRALFQPSEELRVVDTHAMFPEVQPMPLRALDVRLLMALQEDARQSPARLAGRLGVAKRTVERRLAHLQAKGVYFVMPRIHPADLRGMVNGSVTFTLPEKGRTAVVRQVLAAAPEHFVRQLEGPVGMLGLYAPSNAALGKVVEGLRAVQGVSDVRLRFFQWMRLAPGFPAWLGTRLERRARDQG